MSIENFVPKTKFRASHTLLMVLLLASLILAGCAPAASAQTAPSTQTVPPAQTAPTEASTAPSAPTGGKEGVRRFLNTYQDYAFQYPNSYDVAVSGPDGMSLVRGSLLATDQPRLDIQVQPVNNQTLAQAVEQFVAGYPGFELPRAELTLDGEPAVVLDAVPGQDLNRVVLVVHGDTLYTLRFSPSDGQLGEVFSDLETLYNTVIYSFDFDPMP